VLQNRPVLWDVTAMTADALVRTAAYPRHRRLANAVIRGALLVDLAASRMVVQSDDGLHATATQSGLQAADRLLAEIVEPSRADLRRLLWRSRVGVKAVITDFVSRGWWEPLPRTLPRLQRRYWVAEVLAGSALNPTATLVSTWMAALFEGKTDTDAIEAAAADAEAGACTWLLQPVIHELIELKWWLQATAATPVDGD
jgi:hypothetical protein